MSVSKDSVVADILGKKLEGLRTAMMALENAVEQYDHLDSWEDVLSASGELEYANTRLHEMATIEFSKREEEEEDVDDQDQRD